MRKCSLTFTPTHISFVWFWLCWGLTSQSTIFQSCGDGAIASWVINQYFRGVKFLAQGHNTAAVGLEPRTSRSGVRHSTTEPPRSPFSCLRFWKIFKYLKDIHIPLESHFNGFNHFCKLLSNGIPPSRSVFSVFKQTAGDSSQAPNLQMFYVIFSVKSKIWNEVKWSISSITAFIFYTIRKHF